MYRNYPIIEFNNEYIRDITRRISISDLAKENQNSIYFLHEIKTWKRIEDIAYDFYGSCDYYWLIMIANNIVDPFNDWLYKEEDLQDYIYKTYGKWEEQGGKKIWVSTAGDVHHYEDKERGIVMKKAFSGGKAVSNYEYEVSRNEQKRIIKVIYPSLVSDIVNSVNDLFSKG